MKKLMTFATLLFFYSLTFSQDLVIKRGSKGLYLEHKVAAKEGLFPLGRMYNVHPRHIANFNGIDFNKGLAIGQLINIPLSDTNFNQVVDRGVPVYYNTGGSESLANISVKYKAKINSIRYWNKLNSDNVDPNSKLIIGFLVTNELKDKVVIIAPDLEETVSNVKKQESSEKKQPVAEVKKDVIVEESVSNVKKAEDLKKQTEEPRKEVVKPDPVIKEPEPKKEEAKKIEPEVKKEEPPVVKEEPKKNDPVLMKQPETINDNGIGYFKNNFYSQIKSSSASKEQTVTSSIFKTQSGWQDAKYYLLVNGVEPGTIVKITNPSNNKSVFAKVLYPMDKIRENQGVDIRISDAAASSLAVTETDKFILKLNY